MPIAIAILSLNLTFFVSSLSVSPALNDMAFFFKNEGGNSFARMIYLLPFYGFIPVLFFSSILSKMYSKLKIVYFGLWIFSISGIIAFLFHGNKQLLIICRILTGASSGLVMPYSSILISDYFLGRDKNVLFKQLGYVSYLGGVFILLISGLLSTMGWYFVFLLQLSALVPIILFFRYVPELKRKKEVKNSLADVLQTVNFFKINKAGWIILGKTLLVCVFSGVYIVNMPFWVKENALGGSFFVSILQVCYLIAGFLSNAFFGVESIRNRVNTLFVQLFLITLCLALAHIDNRYSAVLSAFLVGFAYGSIPSLSNGDIIKAVSSDIKNFAVAFNSIFMSLAQLFVPTFFSIIAFAIGSSKTSNVFFTTGIIIILFMLIIFLPNIRKIFKRAN